MSSLMSLLMSYLISLLMSPMMQQSYTFYRRGRELPVATSSSLCVWAWLPRSWALQRRRPNLRMHGLDCLACHRAAETPGLHLPGRIRLQSWSGLPWMDTALVLFKQTMIFNFTSIHSYLYFVYRHSRYSYILQHKHWFEKIYSVTFCRDIRGLPRPEIW